MFIQNLLSVHGLPAHRELKHGLSEVHAFRTVCTGLRSWPATHASCRQCSPRQPRLCNQGATLALAPVQMPVLARCLRNMASCGRCSPAWQRLAAITCCGSSIGAGAVPGSCIPLYVNCRQALKIRHEPAMQTASRQGQGMCGPHYQSSEIARTRPCTFSAAQVC